LNQVDVLEVIVEKNVGDNLGNEPKPKKKIVASERTNSTSESSTTSPKSTSTSKKKRQRPKSQIISVTPVFSEEDSESNTRPEKSTRRSVEAMSLEKGRSKNTKKGGPEMRTTSKTSKEKQQRSKTQESTEVKENSQTTNKKKDKSSSRDGSAGNGAHEERASGKEKSVKKGKTVNEEVYEVGGLDELIHDMAEDREAERNGNQKRKAGVSAEADKELDFLDDLSVDEDEEEDED